VNVALVLLDADITGTMGKLARKVVRGMGERALRGELRREVERIVEGQMGRVRGALKEVPKAERASLEAQARELLERDVYKKLRDQAAKLAGESEEAAAGLSRQIESGQVSGQTAGEAADVAKHNRKLARQNAGAYRKLERAAAQNGKLGDEAPRAVAAEARGGANALDAEDMAAMHSTNARGAGAVAREGAELVERHHVLPKEHKAWFQERGFPGDDIDKFCIELPVVEHQVMQCTAVATGSLHARRGPNGNGTRRS
jgi:hypothetical protein